MTDPKPDRYTDWLIADIRKAIESGKNPNAATFRTAERNLRDLYPELAAESDAAFAAMEKRKREQLEQAARDAGVDPSALEVTADGFRIKEQKPDRFSYFSTMGIPVRPWEAIGDPRPREHAIPFAERLKMDPEITWQSLVARVGIGHKFLDCELRIEARCYPRFSGGAELMLVAGLRVPDRNTPPSGYRMRSNGIEASFPVTENELRLWHSERMAVRWIRDRVASLLTHELDEVITLDGDRLFDPHDHGKKIPGAL